MAEVLFQRIKQSRDRQHQTAQAPLNPSNNGRVQAQEDKTSSATTSSTVPESSTTATYATTTQSPQRSQSQYQPPNGAGAGTGVSPTPTPQGKQLPKGVVLGKDGKPCRSCTSVSSWIAMSKAKQHTSSSSSSSSPQTTTSTDTSTPTTLPKDCPPDVDTLGNHTWTLLHSLTASYPPSPTTTHQKEMSTFLHLFSKFYPCWVCAEDFQSWMSSPGNHPRLRNRDEFGTWMCEAHNAVNDKLGKPRFDCNKWEERWRTGWKDGRCD